LREKKGAAAATAPYCCRKKGAAAATTPYCCRKKVQLQQQRHCCKILRDMLKQEMLYNYTTQL